jgi:hypothetical protein
LYYTGGNAGRLHYTHYLLSGIDLPPVVAPPTELGP